MKGAPGFLLAVGLGIIGAFVNWLYLAQKARQFDHVDFVGVAEQVSINKGDRFREDQFMRIPIPQHAVGGLKDAALTWSALGTILGTPATKSYKPGDIILRQDLLTPATTDLLDTLGPNDVAAGVPIDTRTVVVQNLNPGAFVSFIVPRFGGTPTPADGNATKGNASEFVGPFEILALGTRKGQAQLLSASGGSAAQETTMTIRVRMVNNAPDEKWRELLDVMRISNNQPLSVVLHGKDAGKPERKGAG